VWKAVTVSAGVARHVHYIGRKGELEVETDMGQSVAAAISERHLFGTGIWILKHLIVNHSDRSDPAGSRRSWFTTSFSQCLHGRRPTDYSGRYGDSLWKSLL
jgi:hypothetical protein